MCVSAATFLKVFELTCMFRFFFTKNATLLFQQVGTSLHKLVQVKIETCFSSGHFEKKKFNMICLLFFEDELKECFSSKS